MDKKYNKVNTSVTNFGNDLFFIDDSDFFLQW